MSRIACPHCGFQNFAISAYCGRCERPLPKAAESAVPPALPRRSTPPPPPKDIEATVVDRPTASPLIALGSRESSPPVRAVPPPLPPLSIEAAAPAPPIELDKAAQKRLKRAQGPNLGDVAGDPTSEVPVTVPSTLRLSIAHFIDALLVIGVGVLMAYLELWLRGDPFRASSYSAIDQLAEWLSLNREVVIHGTAVVLLCGCAYSIASARQSGQTLGKKLTDTVLVRRSGKPFSWPIVLLRTFLSLISVAFFGAGFVWAVVDPYHRTWHDIFVGTVVVRRHVRISA